MRNTSQIKADVSPDLKRAFHTACIDRGTNMGKVVSELIAEWMEPKRHALVPISEQIAPPIANESDSEIYSLLSELNVKREDLGGDLLKILKSDKALAKEYVRLGILAGMRCLKYDE